MGQIKEGQTHEQVAFFIANNQKAKCRSRSLQRISP